MRIADQIFQMCKCCQMCWESCYWKCIEERFCFDKEIASCRLEESASQWDDRCYTNRAVSLDSVITHQPPNNNHLPNSREVQDLPVMASQIYEVFSKSMIFKDDVITKPDFEDELQERYNMHYRSPPINYSNGKQNRIVSFEDEVIEAQNDLSDFEIMFKEELMADRAMSKIEEEEDENSDKFRLNNRLSASPDDTGISMRPLSKKVSLDSLKDDQSPGENPRISELKFGLLHKTNSETNMKVQPRLENVKGILRVSSLKSIPNADSTNSLNRDSSTSLNKQPVRKISRIQLARVESLKNIDTKNINKIFSRLPQRSASFLSIPEHILQADKASRLSRDVFTISGSNKDESSGEFLQLSHMPDTPVIKSTNLPKFFEETPVIGEYKGDMSLKSMQKPNDVIFTEYDYSMPRFYGKSKSSSELIPSVHASKSMPDLRDDEQSTPTNKVSKRLVKLRSRLKPLIIKKTTDENAKNNTQK